MRYPDYKVQVFRTPAQWRSGLLSKLALDGDGVGLFASPDFEEWLPRGGEPLGLEGAAVATDECGQLLWIRPASPDGEAEPGVELWLYNRDTGLRERLLSIDARPAGAAAPLRPGRLWVTEGTIWLVDEANGRIYGFSRPDHQLVRVVELGGAPLDVAFGGGGRFYALEAGNDGSFRVRALDAREEGSPGFALWTCRDEAGRPLWSRPVALAVGRGALWVLDRGGDRDGPPGDGPRMVRIPVDAGEGRAAARGPGTLCEPPRLPAVTDPGCRAVPIPRKRRDRCGATPDDGLDPDLVPAALEVDCQDNLLVLFEDGAGRPRLFQLDPDASLLGEIALPTREAPPGSPRIRHEIGRIDAILSGPGPQIHLVTDLGTARFDMDHVPVGESGIYYTRTLDNGVEEGVWHRLGLGAELPQGTRLLVEAYAADDAALARSIDTIVDGPRGVQEKKREIETRLGPSWITVADLQGSGSAERVLERPVARSRSPINLNHDLLLNGSRRGGEGRTAAQGEVHRGRYLWLKLTLSSYDETRRPSLREMQLFHPRQSYLRYLPATYQEAPGDPSAESPSRDFLERFLSLFETVLWGLDVEIDRIFEYFDPKAAPGAFLPWLASWLDIALEEEWDDERKRELIARAWGLYERKGTPEGLRELLELATGRRVRILEEARVLPPVPLGRQWVVGRHTFVRGGPERGFRLGDSSVLGRVAVRSAVGEAVDPFSRAAHRFSVLIYGDADDLRSEEGRIRRLIDENKPAHTVYTLRLVGEGAMGGELRVGITTRLERLRPLALGENTTLGSAVAVSRPPPGTRLGSTSRLGPGFELS